MTSDNNVQSIDRALDIIEVLSQENDGLGVTEIASRIGLPKSTAHRIIATMAERGYLSRTDKGVYKIGLKLIEAVSCYINSLELQTEARPYVAQITAELGLTSHLGVLDGDQVVYIEKMDVFSNVRMYSQIGVRVHSYSCSLGKCLLSNFSANQIRKIMANCSFMRFTKKTLGSVDELLADLDKVRSRGWAIDDEEAEIGHRCIGAPIYDYRGDIIAAISASGPTSILTEDRIESVAQYVRKQALEISKSMGYID
ncbi:Pectin degradation repressor protein kdgR [uncultured Eubacterium sp.]|uniref:IclR family transcriptional regulator n=1 Tax=Emergencia sp. TaxID=1926557 RepID=UPI000822F166|nr:Pectin degradation repressor protein kdgR [uncultured Eubacterium sp.]